MEDSKDNRGVLKFVGLCGSVFATPGLTIQIGSKQILFEKSSGRQTEFFAVCRKSG